MKKRSPFWLIWIVVFLAIALWVFLRQGTSLHPLKAIPPYLSEVSIFPLNQVDQSLDLPLQNRPRAKDFNILQQALAYWVDMDLSFDSTLYYAFDRNNPGSVATLMAIQLLSEKKEYPLWTGFISSDQRSEHLYRRTPVVHYEQDGAPTCFFALSKGILFISFDQKQVERSIALMDEKAPNLYIYLKRKKLLGRPDAVQVLFNTGSPTEPRWNQFDWHFLEGTDSLSGTIQLKDLDFQNKLYQQEAVDFSSLFLFLPDRIQAADMISTERAGAYFGERNALGPQFWTPALQALLGPQTAYVLEEAGRESLHASFLIASLKDPEKAREVLGEITDQNGLLEQFSYQAQPISRMLAEDVSSPFYGDRYPDIKNPYWTIVDGFLICSSDPDRLKLWMDYWVLQKNLAQSEVMELFFPILQEKSNRLVLWQAPFPEYRLEGTKEWWPNWTVTHQRGMMSWNKKGGDWKVNGKVRATAPSENLLEISWRKDLLQDVEYGPQILKNPLTGSMHGILVQDREHRLYQLGPDGVYLWDIALDGPVLGDAQAFRINPIEWGVLFNTQQSIYKVDAQGELLATWPLQVPAGQGLQLTVFGEPGDPHFFLPSNNQGVYGYTILGDALINWNPYPVDEGFNTPVFHMASQDKDHLFWLNQERRFRAKYRDGSDVNVQGLPQKIASLFFSEKNGLTYVLGEEGSIGSLSPELVYRELVKKGQRVQSFNWMEKEGTVFLLKKDNKGIQRFSLQSNSVKTAMNLAYAGQIQDLDMIEKDNNYWTFLKNSDKVLILDDKGKRLFPEPIPCDGDYAVFPWQAKIFLATVLEGELVIYRLPL